MILLSGLNSKPEFYKRFIEKNVKYNPLIVETKDNLLYRVSSFNFMSFETFNQRHLILILVLQHFQPIDCPGFQEVGNGESILKFKVFMPDSDNDAIDCMITRHLNTRNSKLK